MKRVLLYSFAVLLSGVTVLMFWPASPPTPPYLSLGDRKLPDDWQSNEFDQLLGQLAWVKGELEDFETLESLKALMNRFQPGALQVTHFSGDEWIELSRHLPGNLLFNPIMGTDAFPFLPHAQDSLIEYPSASVLREVGDEALLQYWNSVALAEGSAAGLGYRIIPAAQLNPSFWNKERVLVFAEVSVGLWPDTLAAMDAIYDQLYPLVEADLSGIYLPEEVLQRVTLHPQTWKNLIREKLRFSGLLLSDYHAADKLVDQQLEASVDIWQVLPGELPQFAVELKGEALEPGSAAEWNERLTRILKAKAWVTNTPEFKAEEPSAPIQQASIGESQTNVRTASLDAPVVAGSDRWEHLSWSWSRSGAVLLSNPANLLPLKQVGKTRHVVLTLSEEPFEIFEKQFSRYANVEVRHLPVDRLPLRPLDVQLTPNTVWTIVFDQERYPESTHGDFVRSVRHFSTQAEVVLVHFGHADQLRHWGKEAAFVHFADRNEYTESLAADLIFGGFSPTGRLSYGVNKDFPSRHGLSFPKSRVQFAPTQTLDVLPQKLVGIDAIINNAIDRGVFPGCQVAVAYQGDILYSKAFGQHTYEEDSKGVKKSDLYDLASLTKVSATTIMAMSLHHKGVLDLRAPIGKYLDIPKGNTMRAIPVSRLLTHQSGLRIGFPIVSLVRGKKKPKVDCDEVYCDHKERPFDIKVAPDLYFSKVYQDSIRKKIWKSQPRYGARYRYSDVNFFVLQTILEKQSGMTLDEWVDENLRNELGLRRLLFNPVDRFSRNEIVPTEMDKEWRQRLVHGYVHDEAAALMGGVSGHAGLFSNAENLAVLFQLVLNGGSYGGVTLFDKGTATLFTENFPGSHRGLGFDKPSYWNSSSRSRRISKKAFGHTGFTGTCVWVDPESDLVFVFLSNRIHPDKKNRKIMEQEVRRKVHDVVYQALGSLEGEPIEGPGWQRSLSLK